MKKLLAFSLLVISFTACRKTISYIGTDPGNNGGTNGGNTGGAGGNTSGSLLIKALSINRKNDTVVILYDYDANGKVSSYSQKGKDDTITYNVSTKVIRNSTGSVLEVDQQSMFTAMFPSLGGSSTTFDPATLAALGINLDSLGMSQIIVHYPSGSTNFDYTTSSMNMMGIATMTTTTNYTYTNGKITKSTVYTSMSMSGVVMQPPTLSSMSEYIFNSAGDLITSKNYVATGTGSTVKLAQTNNYTYSDKPNPMYFGNEGLLLGNELNMSVHMSIQTVSSSINIGNVNGTISNIVYNNNNLPICASQNINTMNGLGTYKLFMYYK
ncbi:hypothetical protein ACI6Q2_09265 [Chitinophagaceae bacterium LWZ2-11]